MNLHETRNPGGGPHRLLTLLLSAAVGLSVGGGARPALADDGARSRIEIVEPGGTLFRKSYNELAGDWANWIQKEPPETNPATDNTGAYCNLNQGRNFWFLAGTFGGLFGEDPIAERTCRIPAGRGIFFPLFSNISFAPEFLATPPCEVLAGEVDQIRCDVTDDTPIAPNVGLEAELDGEPVADLFGYRVQSPPGGFTFALGPLFEVFGLEPGDRFPAVVDGYWILLRPPSPGAHTLSFRVDFDVDGVADLGADYQLFIAGPDD